MYTFSNIIYQEMCRWHDGHKDSKSKAASISDNSQQFSVLPAYYRVQS